MKVSLNWLREFVELPPTVDELVSLLTMAGVEVEGIETTGCAIPNVVVAQIKESVQHPNADRLSVCQVDDGSGTARQIVCGAKNYRVGDKVPLALPGAKLGADFTIKVGKLRGVESQGMLCSAKELNLAEDAEGLLILPPDARVGAPIDELFPGDTVLDLEITPNRADLLSHYGIAREVAALLQSSLRIPELRVAAPVAAKQSVAMGAKDCTFYSVRKLESVRVGPSPAWLVSKLEAVGLRSINNIVDITNYVMMHLGQPLHAFDAAKIEGALQVREAREGERLLALDDKDYSLAAGDVVIADDERCVAIGGVMGGANSGVTAATTAIWLEAADFSPSAIRRASRRLGLVSDSSYRFERGIDWPMVLFASQFAAEMIVELAGATDSGDVRLGYFGEEGSPRETGIHFPGVESSDDDETPVGTVVGVVVIAPLGTERGAWTELRFDRVRQLLGADISDEVIATVLARLGVRREDGRWWAPSFRQDLYREVDLIEEIARVIGMEAIPAKTQARFAPASSSDRAYDRAMTLRRALVAQGLHEARSLTLVPAEPLGQAFTQVSPESLLRVKNPMIDDQIVLRPNLLHGLLSAVRGNLRSGAKSVRLFEVGRTFHTQKPQEYQHAALVVTGPIAGRTWRCGEGADADLFTLKGIVAAVLGEGATFVPEENPALALSIAIQVNGQPVGLAGQLWPADARALDATAPVLFAELDLVALDKARGADAAKKYRDIPRFPATSRDIALLAPLDLPHVRIEASLLEAKEPLLAGVELFDVFTDPTGAKVPADKRSLAYSLTYRSAERTLAAEEVNAAHAKLKERLRSLGVTLRE